jgi:hypothetical protein
MKAGLQNGREASFVYLTVFIAEGLNTEKKPNK